MKSILLLMVISVIGLSHLAAQEAEWKHSIGGINTDYASALAHDNNGDVYITGTAKEIAYFSDTCLSCSVTGEVLGNGNSYLVKYDSNGNYLWSKLLYNGHTTFHGPKEIHLIGNSIHLVFPYFDSIVLDPNASSITINTPGKSAIIHLELDINGNYLNHREILQKDYKYGNDHWYLNDVDFDNNGNLFIAGGFSDTLSVNGTLYGTPQQSGECIFKIEPTNQVTWFYDKMSVLSISVDNQNHLYAGVNFEDSISLVLNNVPSTYYTPDIPNSNLSDALLIRINPSGNIISAKHISGKEDQHIAQVRCQNSKVSIAGTFLDTLLYVPNSTILSCHGQVRDLFIMQFQNDTLLWKKQLYSSSVVYPTDITYSPAGSVFVSGIFLDSLVADYKNAEIVNLSGNGPSIFTVKYAYGQFGFLEQFQALANSNFQLGPRLDFIDDNNFYMIASYEIQMQVNFTGNQVYATSRGGIDGYIAKYKTYNPTSVTNFVTASPSVAVYPNPSQGILNIAADSPIDYLSVYDYTGKKLYYVSVNLNKHTIDISTWADGVYILEVGINKRSESHKLIVSH